MWLSEGRGLGQRGDLQRLQPCPCSCLFLSLCLGWKKPLGTRGPFTSRQDQGLGQGRGLVPGPFP